LHADHLGSASLTTDATGNRVGELRYKPYGETRSEWGVTPTGRRFTGQLEESGLGSLYDYGARRYSPVLGRFLSADTIVPSPGDPQALNRYAYVYNNPLKYTDPTGHCIPGVDCPGMISGVEPPPNGSGLRDQAYAAWLQHYILWMEQDKVETGGVLDSEHSQMTAASELNAFLMKGPQLLKELFYQELMMGAPTVIASLALIGGEGLYTGGELTLAKVRAIWRGSEKATIRIAELRPRRGDERGLSFNITKEGAMQRSGKPNAASFDADAIRQSGNWEIGDLEPDGHVNVRRALAVEQAEWYNYYNDGRWKATPVDQRVDHPYTLELFRYRLVERP